MTTETTTTQTLAEMADRLGVTKSVVRHAVRWARLRPVGRARVRTHGGEKSHPVRLYRPADVASALAAYTRPRPADAPRHAAPSGVRPVLVPDGHEARIRLYAAKVAAGERLFEAGPAPALPPRSLTADDVRAIRARLAAGHRQQDIADDYRVHQVHISRIKLRKTWRHVA